nr:EOG090X07PD [Triops cancriformis]
MTIYSRDSYPYEALGEVSYFWKPGDASTRVLWLWVHPASYEEILLEIKTTFDLTVLQSTASNEVNGPGCTDKVTAKKLAVKNLECTPQWHSSSTPIELTVLKGTLNRFRLIGPLATPILHHVLQPACIETSSTRPEKDEPVAKKPKITKEVTNEPQYWWQDFYQHTAEHKDHRICHQLQKDVWSALALPSNSPKPHSIVPLTVRDPRLLLPPKRTKAFRAPEQEVEDKEDEMDGKTALESDENVVEDNSALKILEVDSRALVCPFWDVTVRNAASIQRLSDHEINQMRSKLLVPGTNLNLGERESRIPVLLVRTPNPNPDVGEFGLGWDLIVPAGWGIAFWMNLVYRGGRVGGLKELRGFYYESGVLDPNLSLPDTRSSPRELTLEKQKLMEEYFKKPPKNRVNFIKLGTVCPFIPHWNQLIQDWYSTLGKWYVLRKACKQLDDLRQVWCSNSAAETLSRLERTFASQKCLVAVQVVCLGKGKPDHNCSISLPTDEDLQKLETNPSFVGPVEEAHADPNAKLRKKMRQEHEKEVKKLRRQRVQAKRSGDADQLQGAQSKSQTACEQFNATTRDLWLPDESQAIRTSMHKRSVIRAPGQRVTGHDPSLQFTDHGSRILTRKLKSVNESRDPDHKMI